MEFCLIYGNGFDGGNSVNVLQLVLCTPLSSMGGNLSMYGTVLICDYLSIYGDLSMYGNLSIYVDLPIYDYQWIYRYTLILKIMVADSYQDSRYSR